MSKSYINSLEVMVKAAATKYVLFNTKAAYLTGQDASGLEFDTFLVFFSITQNF